MKSDNGPEKCKNKWAQGDLVVGVRQSVTEGCL